MLRAQEYSAVVIDESLLEREPAESETVLQHIGNGCADPYQLCHQRNRSRSARGFWRRGTVVIRIGIFRQFASKPCVTN